MSWSWIGSSRHGRRQTSRAAACFDQHLQIATELEDRISRGNALGNLSLESYDDVENRKDLLVNYGPYGMPGLLVKVAPTFKLALTNWKSSAPLIINTNIAHVGGSLIDITSTSFTQLQTWMENGASENNARQADKKYDKGACSPTVRRKRCSRRTTCARSTMSTQTFTSIRTRVT